MCSHVNGTHGWLFVMPGVRDQPDRRVEIRPAIHPLGLKEGGRSCERLLRRLRRTARTSGRAHVVIRNRDGPLTSRNSSSATSGRRPSASQRVIYTRSRTKPVRCSRWWVTYLNLA
jgi:hypothetical protein